MKESKLQKAGPPALKEVRTEVVETEVDLEQCSAKTMRMLWGGPVRELCVRGILTHFWSLSMLWRIFLCMCVCVSHNSKTEIKCNRVYPKCLLKSSVMSSSHKNEEQSSSKHVSGKEWFLNLIERRHSTISTLLRNILLMSDIIHLQWYFFNCLSSHNTQQMFTMPSPWINSHMYMSDYRLSHSF
jgi:hypothetical protein